MITENDIIWEKLCHWTLRKWYVTIYADKQYGLSKQAYVHRDANGFPTNKTKNEFFIDGIRKTFKKIEKMIEHYNTLPKK